jgi:enoyl-CoA hydratase/carnithine racemase
MFAARTLATRTAAFARPQQLRLLSSLKPAYDNIIVTAAGDNNSVGLITLNRPKALNALCDALLDDLIHATTVMDNDPAIGCIVITGSEKAFAAGADIKEMQSRGFAEVFTKNMFKNWGDVAAIQKPTIAAINGFALGGGCELAMMCDIMVCGDKAKFGQPEINLGVIPGCGGTQRLIRAVGKSKAMEMCLAGTMIGAEEARTSGLVAQVYPAADLVTEAVKMASSIASKSQVATATVKETVNAAYELNLAEGLRFERRMFHALFATEDQTEGMTAFVEKRAAVWKNK